METHPRRSAAEESRIAVSEVELNVRERPGAEPAVLFLHATGFHARCWDEVIARLPGRRAIAYDARGHGCSSKPAPPYHWRDFGRDAAALARALRLRGAVAVGHSMGGHSAALAAKLEPDAFSELILIDPVIFPEPWYKGVSPELEMVMNRRNRWLHWEDMFRRFKDKKPFDRWNRKVLLDYCVYGVVPNGGSRGFVLACPPEVEASVYSHATAPDANIYAEIARIRAAVQVIRTSRFLSQPGDFLLSPTAPDVVSKFPNAVDRRYPDHSHFLPMEAPDLVADLILHREQ
jgi:pimeloyl-ACP methyl ester carboxylesterase